jgi:hypothetical protein
VSKQAEADLILKLYDLRREATMRKAREWFFREFQPQSIDDIQSVMFGENGGHLRMVLSYWDMAASLVNHGAIGMELFNDANAEHMGVFSKVERWLPEMRPRFGQNMCVQLERLIDATPNGRETAAAMRERMKAIMSEMLSRRTAAQGGASA